MHNDIANHLRAWGLKVEEKSGWQNRGRPGTFSPRGVLCHHTASNKNSGNFGSDNIVTHGRSDLPGPLCQFLLGRNGVVRIVAGGRSNHAGTGGPRAGIPANAGNSYLWGIEAENNGIGEKWSAEELNAYYRLCAALLSYMRINDVSKVFGHKEWTSRKIDPTGLNMDEFRKRVRQALDAGPSAKVLTLSKLTPGKRNAEVATLKKKLAKLGFFTVTPITNYYGKGLEAAVRRFQEAQGWEGSDADGIPGRVTLAKLGFVAK